MIVDRFGARRDHELRARPKAHEVEEQLGHLLVALIAAQLGQSSVVNVCGELKSASASRSTSRRITCARADHVVEPGAGRSPANPFPDQLGKLDGGSADRL
jgi:hypothetical protein